MPIKVKPKGVVNPTQSQILTVEDEKSQLITSGKYEAYTPPPTEEEEEQPTVDEIFSGLESSTTLEDIRAQQAKEEEARELNAEAIYGPRIRQAEELQERQVGSARGAMGQARGLGLSSAKVSFLNAVENDAQDKIDEIKKEKEAYISSGDAQAAQRADERIAQMEDRKLQISLAKMDYVLKSEQISMEKEEFAFNKIIATAGLTGEFEGDLTLEAKQQKFSQKIAEANITGLYEGQETISMQQLGLQEQQLGLSKEELELKKKDFKKKWEQQPFENQLAVYSLLATIPSNQSITVTLPGQGKQTFKGLKKVTISGTPSSTDPEVIALAEQVLDPNNEYILKDVPASMVEKVSLAMSEMSGMTEADAKEKVKKGISFNMQVAGTDPQVEREEIYNAVRTGELTRDEAAELLNHINTIEEQSTESIMTTADTGVGKFGQKLKFLGKGLFEAPTTINRGVYNFLEGLF